MKGQEEMGDEELVEIDEKDTPIQTKKDKEKSNKPLSKSNIAIIIIVCLIILVSCYCFFNHKKNNNKSVFDETILKNLKLKNRVFFGPISHTAEKIETIVKNDVAFVITEGAVFGDYTFPNYNLKDLSE